jgi:2-phosphoglycerate kinase
VLLVTGGSHTGKSTLARQISDRTGATIHATDDMARHPGRPWGHCPHHVLTYYQSLPDNVVFTLLLQHYDNIWPMIEMCIEKCVAQNGVQIIEGSALRPERLAKIERAGVTCVYLSADPDLIRDRIYRKSCYSTLNIAAQRAVDTFVTRSLADADHIDASAKHMGLKQLAVTERGYDSDALEMCIDALKQD